MYLTPFGSGYRKIGRFRKNEDNKHLIKNREKDDFLGLVKDSGNNETRPT